MPAGLKFEKVNKTLKKKDLLSLIASVYKDFGLKDSVLFADKLMYLGLSIQPLQALQLALMILRFRTIKPRSYQMQKVKFKA